MYTLEKTSRFKKGVKRLQKRGKNFDTFKYIIFQLSLGKKLPRKYKNHPLKGNWQGAYDCHIEPDWVLIYEIDNEARLLRLIATGSHADLFDM